MALWNWRKKVDDEGKEGFTLPDELTEKINAGASAAEQLPKITQILEGLQSTMLASTQAQQKRDEEAAKAVKAQQQQQQQEVSDTEFEELMLTNPKAGVNKAMAPLAQELVLLRFNNTKRDLFEGEPEKFEYYHGELKQEIDRLIENQPISFKANAQFAAENIKNCYDAVIGKHHKEILDGKLKTRFAASSGKGGTSTGSAGSSGAAEKRTVGEV